MPYSINNFGNTAIGYHALFNNLTGDRNFGLGENAMFSNTAGSYNVGIGNNVLYYKETGNYDLAIGTDAGRYIADGSHLTVSNNSLFLGRNTRANADSETNQIIIGYNAIGKGSNTATIGDVNMTALYLPNDNYKLITGEDGDVEQYYDGTDYILDTGVVTASDFIIDCGTEKTIELKEVVYDDLQVNIGEIAGNGWFGAQWSDIVEYRGGVALRLANSTSNNYKFKFNAQLKHKYAEGEDINFHIHIGNNSTTSGDVVLKLTWEWANVNGTYGGTTTETKTFSVTGTNGLHQVFGFSTALTGTGKKISSIVLAKVERISNDVADTFSEDLNVIGIDYHVPHNTMGSRQEWIK